MIKTLFYTFLKTKDQEENANSTDCDPQEIEIRPITLSPWHIVKTLSLDELCTGGKFELPVETVWDTMLRHEPRDLMSFTNVLVSSFQIQVNDLDTNTFHNVVVWKYPHEDAFYMRESWIEEFVWRRMLVAGMVVGMYWDFDVHMLCFSVLEGSE